MSMYTHPQYATVSELRSILSVMEERSHLRLDNESANRIREVLERRIADRKNTSARISASSVAVAVEESQLLV
jgi:hypothetical protein